MNAHAPVSPATGPITIPDDPTSTPYPLFWETYAAVDAKPQFREVHPNRPDRFAARDAGPLPRTAVPLLQALRRNSPYRDEPASLTVTAEDGGYAREDGTP
jgi:hypothetical protein